MDFKVRVKCQKCLCSFELRSKETQSKTVSCPNCGLAVKDDVRDHLLKGLDELSKVENYDECSTFMKKEELGFSFEIVLPDGSFGNFT